jgi:hypothetical protein
VKLRDRYYRWLRFHRLRKVPRRTYIVATTHARALQAAERLGVDPNAPTTVLVQGYRAMEGRRFLPGDRIVAEGLPVHVLDVVTRGLISSGVGIKSRDLYVFEVTR